MKIVHLLKHAVRGNGSVHMAVDLACAQAKSGHEVYFASARGSYDDLLREQGVHVTPLPEPVNVRTAVQYEAALLKLASRVRPDVLHTHMMSTVVLARPVATVFRCPVVATMHNSFDQHSGLMRLSKRVVAVSSAERTQLLERGFSDQRVSVVLNATAQSARMTLPVDDIGPMQTPCVMTLSGLHPRKGVNDTIDAFALVHKDFPDWHLNIVGWGPSREDLEQQVASLGIQDNVHFLGSTLTPWPLLDEASIVVAASLADPCPLTVIEARVAGCAVVGSTVGGIPEVLENGASGHLVPPQDPSAIADALRELMGSPAALAQWRERSARGSDYFSVDRMAKDYDQVYAEAGAGT
ncbi:glycosyltransferase family 4 protein [Branchiibius sp. NY16-3462-2]|uniref:glycosyltransferase family 4 protein n=1 Tax=Branchiibius sp. NY16-3462-2 TaxID=1807500 RepID=UPI0007992A7C|nr:glycosyltransferase family 4 protein [Branchiibius sp. NY16-3462-2]KYH44977.1 hypothetical protein AZH51_13850 [Branchiibius sp. NY16-3462-2]